MSKELFRTRCTKGHFVIYDDKVALEMKILGAVQSESLSRDQLVGVDVNITLAPLFGVKYSGAGTVTVNSTGGKSLQAKMVRLKHVQEIKSLLS